jgi:hypothetical protein
MREHNECTVRQGIDRWRVILMPHPPKKDPEDYEDPGRKADKRTLEEGSKDAALEMLESGYDKDFVAKSLGLKK